MRTFPNNVILFSAILLSLVACRPRLQQTTASPKPRGFHGPVAQRNDTISAARSREEETFVKGCTQKSLGNNAQALVYFQECLVMNPKNAAANYEIAKLYLQSGKTDRALPYAKTATTLSPDNTWYALLYAQALEKNENYSDAALIYKQLSDRDPRNTDLLYDYAALLAKSGKPDDALKIYDRIETIDGVSDTLVGCRISVYEKNQDNAGEEKELIRLTTAYPDELKYWNLLRDFYEKNAAIDKAEQLNNKMVRLFPTSVAAKLKVYFYEKDPNPSFKDLVAIFNMPGDEDVKIDFLKYKYPPDDPQAMKNIPNYSRDADSLCSILRQLYPGNKNVLLISADYLRNGGSDPGPARARDFYRQAIELDKNQYEAWKNILQIDFYLNDTVSEVKDCQSVIDLFPSQPDGYYFVGQVQYARKDFRHAIGNLQMASDYTMDSTIRYEKITPLLANAYYAIGDFARAEDQLKKIIQNTPADARLYERMGDIQFRLGKTDDAVRYWKTAKDKGDTNPNLDKKINSRSMSDDE